MQLFFLCRKALEYVFCTYYAFSQWIIIWCNLKLVWGICGNVNNCPSTWKTEKAMALHSSTLAWKIPRMEEPGRLQSMGSLRVGHNWATSLSIFTFMHWRRKWQPTPVFLPGESEGQRAWWASVYGVEKSWTRLTRLSSSSNCSSSISDLSIWELRQH